MASAQVRIKGLKELLKSVDKAFEKTTKNKQMYSDMGVFLTKRIQAQVKVGKPLNDTGKFPPLKNSTKAIRKGLADINHTAPNFKFNKSNLTFTGQLVEAIDYKVTPRTVLEVAVQNTKRIPYTNLDGRQDTTGPKKNSTLDRRLRAMGFIMFTAKGIEKNTKITKRLRSIALKYLRRSLKAQN